MGLREFGFEIDGEEHKNEEMMKIGLDSPEYPHLLRIIEKPPKILYARGNIALLSKPAIAIVGTRKPSEKGVWYAERIARVYADRGFVIVSGLSLGVDTIAIKSALETGGKVIAVLPTLGKITPKSNRNLAEKIIRSGGLLISEYKKRSVQKYMYVTRNRIISGISLGVVVVETGVEGGTMHTVKYAKEQKRLIVVADLHAEGNRILIDEGYPVLRLL